MASDSPWSAVAGGTLLTVRVTPRAGRTAIAGLGDGRVLVRLAAPPVDGAANDALLALFARRLGLPRSAVTIVRGLRSREKQVRIDGLSPDLVRARLDPQPTSAP
jgi:uncharacterized protein